MTQQQTTKLKTKDASTVLAWYIMDYCPELSFDTLFQKMSSDLDFRNKVLNYLDDSLVDVRFSQSRTQTIQECIEVVEGMKPEYDPTSMSQYNQEMRQVNYSCDDIITNLKQMKI
jgi:hypothetical protein